jgi:hypothetical protein
MLLMLTAVERSRVHPGEVLFQVIRFEAREGICGRVGRERSKRVTISNLLMTPTVTEEVQM